MPTVVPEGQLVYGMQLPIQSQSTMFAEPWEASAGPAELGELAQVADRSGFFYIAVCDHVAIPRAAAVAMSTIWYDTIATLGWLAAQTTNVRLLSSVYNLTYRHPLVAAKSFATLDALSGGRVIAGLGAGHLQGEFEALGVDFEGRGKNLNAAIDLFDEALRNEYVGDVGAQPRPVQTPRPPIWLGGGASVAVKRAATKGDGWIPQGTPIDQMPELVKLFLDARDGRPGDIGCITEWIYSGTPSWDLGRPHISGSAEEIAERMRAWQAVGVNHLQVRFPSRSAAELAEQMEAFGTDVAPLLK